MRDTVVLLAAAAVVVGAGLYLSRRNGAGGVLPSFNVARSGSPDTIINNALPGQPGWGWQYFADGIAIGPDGAYYKNGSRVWTPTE